MKRFTLELFHAGSKIGDLDWNAAIANCQNFSPEFIMFVPEVWNT